MFTTALLTEVKGQNQPVSSSTGMDNGNIYMHAMEFSFQPERKMKLSFAGKWIQLERILSRELSQSQKGKNVCRLQYVVPRLY